MTLSEARTSESRIGRNGMAALSPNFTGDLLRPGDAGFNEAAAIWNGVVERQSEQRRSQYSDCDDTTPYEHVLSWLAQMDGPRRLRESFPSWFRLTELARVPQKFPFGAMRAPATNSSINQSPFPIRRG